MSRMGLDHYRDVSRKSRNNPYEAIHLFHQAVSSGDTLKEQVAEPATTRPAAITLPIRPHFGGRTSDVLGGLGLI